MASHNGINKCRELLYYEVVTCESSPCLDDDSGKGRGQEGIDGITNEPSQNYQHAFCSIHELSP